MTMSTPYAVRYEQKKRLRAPHIHTHTGHKLAHFRILCYCSLSSSHPLLYFCLIFLFQPYKFIHRFVASIGHGSWWLIDDDSKPFKPSIKR